VEDSSGEKAFYEEGEQGSCKHGGDAPKEHDSGDESVFSKRSAKKVAWRHCFISFGKRWDELLKRTLCAHNERILQKGESEKQSCNTLGTGDVCLFGICLAARAPI
jgi:hypothetical protein